MAVMADQSLPGSFKAGCENASLGPLKRAACHYCSPPRFPKQAGALCHLESSFGAVAVDATLRSCSRAGQRAEVGKINRDSPIPSKQTTDEGGRSCGHHAAAVSGCASRRRMGCRR